MDDFYGHATGTIENGQVRLVYLATAGPRIVGLFCDGSEQNLLAETPDLGWETPAGTLRLYGGHRLWVAPEVPARTYVPDNEGVVVTALADGVSLYRPAEGAAGIGKTLEIHLHPAEAAVSLLHHLDNEGAQTVEVAPWAITQLPLGGTAILPQPVEPVDAGGLRPNRQLALWPYSDWDDPRFRPGNELILVDGKPQERAFKLGTFSRHGWAGYLYPDRTLLAKSFAVAPERRYPDLNSNVEVYVWDHFLELETLGPLTRLEPGQRVSHREEWRLHSDVPPATVAAFAP